MKSKIIKTKEQIEIELKINKAILNKIKKEKLTYSELARDLGISEYKLIRFLSGNIDPKLDFLKKVTYGLGLRLTIS
ncbi:MAG: hypothetical protein Q7R78_01915 [bacterium]|nr:hypothetical protein [bacterium]